MSVQLSKALFAKVANTDNSFNTAIGGIYPGTSGRFYPEGDIKETEATRPYATYLITPRIRNGTFRQEIDDLRIQIKNVSDDSSKEEADVLNDLARNLLHNQSLSVVDYKNTLPLVVNQLPAFKSEDNKDWLSITDFKIKLEEE